MINISFGEVLELSRTHNVIPIVDSLFSSGITPLGAFESMTQMQPGSFLLESAEHGVWSRYSFVGISARGFLKQEFGEASQWLFAGFVVNTEVVNLHGCTCRRFDSGAHGHLLDGELSRCWLEHWF